MGSNGILLDDIQKAGHYQQAVLQVANIVLLVFQRQIADAPQQNLDQARRPNMLHSPIFQAHHTFNLGIHLIPQFHKAVLHH